MRTTRRRLSTLFVLSSLLLPVFALAAASVTTLGTQTNPQGVAINTVTNKIFVSNFNSASVSLIDGSDNTSKTIPVDNGPSAIKVDEATNKIYVTDQNANLVTVIDGIPPYNTRSVPVGNTPLAIDVNPVTNKIYVCNYYGNSVTVIHGSDLTTTTIPNINHPNAVAVNSVTNKIYVVNNYNAVLVVIDGASDTVDTTLTLGANPGGIAINTATDKIYVADYNSQGITVIDGHTNSTKYVFTANNPNSVAVNPVTNLVYVTNYGSNNVTVLDGTSDSEITNIKVQTRPNSVAVNSVKSLVYVTNSGSNSVSIIQGDPNDPYYNMVVQTVGVGGSPQSITVNPVTNRIYNTNPPSNSASVIFYANSQFVSVAPCRLVDTRNANGEFGGPPLQGGKTRTFTIPDNKTCNIPATASAYSLNVTVVPHGKLGYLTIWPAGGSQPKVSTLNSDGRVKANAAIVPAGSQGGVSVYVTDTTDLILDIDGYFVPATTTTLAFYPLPPCRVADTRDANGDLGGPYLKAQVPRDFPILEATACNIPDSAQAYSLNFTAVPHGPLAYLTVWPTGQPQPNVSTLNAPTGTVTANAAIVPAGTSGKISTYAYNDTDLIIDIDGYFALPDAGGLSLYNLTPCRVLDTRKAAGGNGPFQGTLSPPIDVLNSPCQPPDESQAYVFNATVVPPGPLGYLTLWPDGLSQPTVSTLNAADGAISSNMAIVPAGTSGKVDAYAFNLTDLILDISGYFGPLQK